MKIKYELSMAEIHRIMKAIIILDKMELPEEAKKELEKIKSNIQYDTTADILKECGLLGL